MVDIRVVPFTPKNKTSDEDRLGELPTKEIIDELLVNKPMKGCIVITVNEDGYMSYYWDNLSSYEVLGIMETAKVSISNECLD